MYAVLSRLITARQSEFCQYSVGSGLPGLQRFRLSALELFGEPEPGERRRELFIRMSVLSSWETTMSWFQRRRRWDNCSLGPSQFVTSSILGSSEKPELVFCVKANEGPKV